MIKIQLVDISLDNNKIIINQATNRVTLYTSFRYIQKLKIKEIIRSMLESGKPTQNAPVESSFGYFKDEVEYKDCKTLKELKDKIKKYVYYYNTGRYQWNKRMLPPCKVKNI